MPRQVSTILAYLRQRNSLCASVANIRRLRYLTINASHWGRSLPQSSTMDSPSSSAFPTSDNELVFDSFLDNVATTLGCAPSTVSSCAALPKPVCGQMNTWLG